MSTAPDYGNVNARRHQWLGAEERSHYIPAWYEPHTHLDMEVTRYGRPLGFTIRNVLPFRRWAIDATGEILEQHVFDEKYKQYLGAFKTDQHFSELYESMPAVQSFVSQKFDGNGQLVDIFYNDDGRVEKTEKYTADGEVAPEWIARNADQADKLSKIEALTELLKDGIITKEQYTAKTTAILGVVAQVEAAKEPLPVTAAPVKKQRKPLTEAQKQRARENIAKAREKKLALRADKIEEAVNG